jgi:exopolysaccharide production protein ExoQ
MRKVSGSVRTHPRPPQIPGGANRKPGPNISRKPTTTKVEGAGWVAVLLGILFWSIFYQNLPGSLEGFAYSGPVSAANNVDRSIKICMLALSVYVIASRWGLARSVARDFNAGAAALLVLAALSAVWSFDRAATILRFTSEAAIFSVGFAIALAGWHRQRLQQLAIPPLMLILIASLVVGIILPDKIAEIGTDISQRGAWHGITHGKNEFGMVASLGTIFCIHRCLAREGRLSWAIAGATAAFSCLILSRSNTSLFATMVGVLFMALVIQVPMIRKRYSAHVAVAIAGGIAFSELAIQKVIPGLSVLTSPISILTGKDSTFSARGIIWNVVKEHIKSAPFLGSGYGAYWVGPFETSPSYVFVYTMFFYPTEAHNGYIDITNDLGFLGLICLLVFLFIYVRQGIQLMRIDRTQAALYLALLFQEMVINMSESDWFSRTNTFAVFALTITCMSRSLFEAQRGAKAAGSAVR